MSEKKITYLLGAGASYNTLPLVENFKVYLNEFLGYISDLDILSDSQYFLGISNMYTQREYFELFKQTIEWMSDQSDKHASIDTFAKKLLVTNSNDELRRLKAGLTSYFILEQIRRQTNQRYDSFIASIIDHKKRRENLPNNINIISWNYDFQIEKAYTDYCSLTKNTDQIHALLNLHPSNGANSVDSDIFGIYKINGTTNVYNNGKSEILCLNDLDINDVIEKTIKIYAGLIERRPEYYSSLTFAWEEDPTAQDVISNAIISTKNTEILVVIGYSFPFFNREIDRKIIQGMTNLKKIYFQSPDAKDVIIKFGSILKDFKNSKGVKVDAEPITDVKQFYLPPEL